MAKPPAKSDYMRRREDRAAGARAGTFGFGAEDRPDVGARQALRRERQLADEMEKELRDFKAAVGRRMADNRKRGN